MEISVETTNLVEELNVPDKLIQKNNLFESYMNSLNVSYPIFKEQQDLLKIIHRILYPQYITHYIPHNTRITDIRTGESDISIINTNDCWQWELSKECDLLNEDTLQNRTGGLLGTFIWNGTERFALWCDATHKIVHGFTMNNESLKLAYVIQDMVTTIWGPLWTLQMDTFNLTYIGGTGKSNLSIFWSLRYLLLRQDGNDHNSTLKLINNNGVNGLLDMFRKFVIND
jgi:hypothetical protein